MKLTEVLCQAYEKLEKENKYLKNERKFQTEQMERMVKQSNNDYKEMNLLRLSEQELKTKVKELEIKFDKSLFFSNIIEFCYSEIKKNQNKPLNKRNWSYCHSAIKEMFEKLKDK